MVSRFLPPVHEFFFFALPKLCFWEGKKRTGGEGRGNGRYWRFQTNSVRREERKETLGSLVVNVIFSHHSRRRVSSSSSKFEWPSRSRCTTSPEVWPRYEARSFVQRSRWLVLMFLLFVIIVLHLLPQPRPLQQDSPHQSLPLHPRPRHTQSCNKGGIGEKQWVRLRNVSRGERPLLLLIIFLVCWKCMPISWDCLSKFWSWREEDQWDEGALVAEHPLSEPLWPPDFPKSKRNALPPVWCWKDKKTKTCRKKKGKKNANAKKKNQTQYK